MGERGAGEGWQLKEAQRRSPKAQRLDAAAAVHPPKTHAALRAAHLSAAARALSSSPPTIPCAHSAAYAGVPGRAPDKKLK